MDCSKPLTSCPICDSRLIYPVDARRHPEGGAVIERRCPECEHSDIVVAGLEAARRWGRREQRVRVELVRAVLALEVEEILGSPDAHLT
jgi:transcriptional regulator NrdR family protein